MKRIITGALALLLAVAALGCTSRTKRVLSEAFEKLNEAKSMHMEMDVTVVAQTLPGSDADGEPQAIRMYESMDYHKPTETMQIDVSAQIEAKVGEPTEALKLVQYRIYRDGDERKGALSYNGETWYSTTVSSLSGVAYQDPAAQIDAFFSYGDRFTLIGTETVDGMAVTVYEGIFDSKSMKEILERYLSGSGVPLITFRDELWAELPDVTARIGIGENGYPVTIEIDVAAFMQKLLDHLLGALQRDSHLSISEMTFAYRYSGFNTVDEIPAPDNVQDSLIDDSDIGLSMFMP